MRETGEYGQASGLGGAAEARGGLGTSRLGVRESTIQEGGGGGGGEEQGVRERKNIWGY